MPSPRLLRHTTIFLYPAATLSLWLCATLIVLNDNLLETSFVQGASMSPTLSPSYDTTGRRDLVLWNKWWSVSHNSVKRGDVILFRSPSHPDLNAVKRVVAIEGDRVLLDPRRRPSRERDGADIPESRAWDAMLTMSKSTSTSTTNGEANETEAKGMQIPEGHVWVEGDYWRKSWDSNAYGPISKSLILGKAVAVVWPVEKFWTRPWLGFEGGTGVVPGTGRGGRRGEEMGLVGAIRAG